MVATMYKYHYSLIRNGICTLLISVGIAFAASVQAATIQDYQAAVIAADKEQGSLPVMDQEGEIPLPLSAAYLIQQELIRSRTDAGAVVAGFKAGLTTTQAQKKFGVDGPLVGVLMQGAKLEDPIYRLQPGHKTVVEQELAFRLKGDVLNSFGPQTPLSDIVDAVAPAIEVADLGFTAKPSAFDIAANNVANRAYWVGEWRPLIDVTRKALTDTPVSLVCQNTSVNTSTTGATLDGQRSAIIWLLNAALRQGYALSKGQILLTGSLGNMVPAKPCNYTATYGDFGSTPFSVEAGPK
ncbi:2-oxopent-4-enoate hydratase [BD1-7 clade bacterium]|uniref:2-oxopent-4-enoate hydratase n=1 Tax=BD1-7 clade bacterium TaxID=2029982 RepID=A0A5S9QA65_9GAMM|nr:2-oxopent-4-enoate hydratase [BD1-7 clade bacterium]CAA0114310.1 2-oxopent-4-enoate hydratase [BD1-7 clade bacterium]